MGLLARVCRHFVHPFDCFPIQAADLNRLPVYQLIQISSLCRVAVTRPNCFGSLSPVMNPVAVGFDCPVNQNSDCFANPAESLAHSGPIRFLSLIHI